MQQVSEAGVVVVAGMVAVRLVNVDVSGCGNGTRDDGMGGCDSATR